MAMKNIRLALGVGGLFVVFCLDRITKWLAVNVMPAGGWFIWPRIIGMQLERNQGIAYSIPLPSLFLAIVVGMIIVVLAWLVVWFIQRKEPLIAWALVLIALGAFSNLLDRLHYGYVVDLFVLSRRMVFNLADLMITAGAIWLVVLFLKKPKNAAQDEIHFGHPFL